MGNDAADVGQLLPMLQAVKDTGQAPGQLLADAGYRSEKNLEDLAGSGIAAVVALGREAKRCAEIDVEHSPHTVAMAAKLQRNEGRAACRRRKWIAEPSNGWIKSVLGFRQFSLRGLHRVPLQVASAVNEVWSMDFVSDSLANGRRLKCLTVADDFSHECVDTTVDQGISGEYVTRLLDRAAVFRAYPAAVRTDNGPEFTSRAPIAWTQEHHVRHLLIEPGKPMQYGHVESFNGKFRDECLNELWFQTLQQARETIAHWRRDYNEVRPHGCIGRIPPARVAGQHRRHAGGAAHQTPAADEIT